MASPTRIKDITTTANSTASDDYFVIDGATGGTRKYAHNLDPIAHVVALIPGLVAGWDYRATTVVGGKITSWADLSGNGHTLTSTTDAYRATFHRDGAILSDSGDVAADRGYAITGNLSLDGRSSTVILIRSNLPGLPSDNTRYEALLYNSSPLYPLFLRDGHSWSHYYLNGLEMSDLIDGYALARGASSAVVYTNSNPPVASGAHPAGTETYSRLFALNTGSNPMTGVIRAVLCYDRQLEQGEINSIFTAYNVSPMKESLLITRGDSITLGQGASTNGKRWGEIVARDCGYSLINGGSRGAESGDIVTQGAGLNSIFTPSGAHLVVAVIGYGSNDLGTGTGKVAALEANIQTIAGWFRTRYNGLTKNKVLISTLLPRTVGFSGGQTAGQFETDRLAYRTWLLANYASFADGVVDIGDPATALGNVANVGTYFGDGTHPNDAGYALYAAAVAAKITALT